jgi:hypothetical protein
VESKTEIMQHVLKCSTFLCCLNIMHKVNSFNEIISCRLKWVSVLGRDRVLHFSFMPLEGCGPTQLLTISYRGPVLLRLSG